MFHVKQTPSSTTHAAKQDSNGPSHKSLIIVDFWSILGAEIDSYYMAALGIFGAHRINKLELDIGEPKLR
jgi:hypothetical protein